MMLLKNKVISTLFPIPVSYTCWNMEQSALKGFWCVVCGAWVAQQWPSLAPNWKASASPIELHAAFETPHYHSCGAAAIISVLLLLPRERSERGFLIFFVPLPRTICKSTRARRLLLYGAMHTRPNIFIALLWFWERSRTAIIHNERLCNAICA